MKKISTLLPLFLVFFLSEAQIPTYNDNVACILFTNCTPCHHDGGIAPFSLITYTDAANAAIGVQGAINAGSMPPWPPNPDYTHLAHERVLTQEEIDIINDWVNNGTPEGSGTPPMAPMYDGTEIITSPDLVIEMQPFTNFENTEDLYQCFVVPSGLTEEMFIGGFEVIPGNPEMVHHLLVFADTSNIPAQLDAADPNPGYTGFGGTGSESSQLIGLWVPGEQTFFYPANMGVKLLPGTNIILQLHYPGGTGGQVDQTIINFDLFVGDSFTREVSFSSVLEDSYTLTDGPLIIPPNEVSSFHNEFQVPNVDVTLLAVGPHMHLLGKSIKSFAITPTNETVPLFDIPEWDFHYQGFYQFRQPIKIPANSTLYGEASYDNTASNPNQPSDPPQWVFLGEATTDEMFLIYFAYTVYLPGDENIVIDTSTVKPTYNNCEFNILGIEDELGENLFVYPNPVVDNLQLNISQTNVLDIKLRDINGRLVSTIDPKSRMMDVSNLSEGVYMLSISVEGGTSTRKIIVRK
jgi:hypothetical protein